MNLVILIILTYLLGSLPFGYWIAKLKGIDITTVGSGNIGTTNVWRILGAKWGVVTFLGDTIKGFLAVTLVNIFFLDPLIGYYILAGSLAIIGHYKSIFLKFKGGKAVATSLGVIFGLLPFWFAFILLGVFGFILLVSKQVSLGSIAAAVAAVIAKILFLGGFNEQQYGTTLFIICVAALIIIAHKENITRILKGTERRI